MDRKKLVSNSRIFNYNLFAPDNRDALEIMNTLAKSVRVSKLSSISLTDFYSVEASFVLVSPNNSSVNISISFLRHHDMLFSLIGLGLWFRRKNGKWSTIDFAIYCGDDWDSMSMCQSSCYSCVVTLAKLSFAHKGPEEPSGYYGFESIIEETIEEPSVSESSNELPITGNFSDECSANDDNEMSEESEHGEEEENAETANADREVAEEELIKFDVNNDLVKQLGAILNPAMPPEVFLMYLVSMEFISFDSFILCFLHCTGKQLGISTSVSTICWWTVRYLQILVLLQNRSCLFVENFKSYS